MNWPKTRMTVDARATHPQPFHDTYEGEAIMSQQQQDAYKDLLGDEKGKVSVSRDIAEKDFGSGGGVSVMVTLTCDQSRDKVNQAIALAYEIADGACWHYQKQIKQQLVTAGILRQ